MRTAPFACSACGSRYWPDPDSSCDLCQPHYEADERRRYAEPDWEADHDSRMMREEEEEQTETN